MRRDNIMLWWFVLLLLLHYAVHTQTQTTTLSIISKQEHHDNKLKLHNYTFNLYTTHATIEIHRVEYFNGTNRVVKPFHSIDKISELSDFANIQCGKYVFERYNDAITPNMLYNKHHHESGFLLPCLYPHNRLELSKYPQIYCDTPIQRERRHLLILIILKRKETIVDDCLLHFKRPSEQFTWPIIYLYNSTKYHLVDNVNLEEIDTTPLVSYDDASQFTTTRSLFIDSNLWSTSSNNDDNDNDAYKRPNSITSFVEVESMVTILGAAMDAVIRPIMKEALGRVCRDIQHRMTQEVTNAAMERVPEQVIELVTVPMKYNISNGVLDAASFRIIDTLTKSFTNELGPTIADKIATTLVPQLHEQITPILTHAVADDIMHMLPQLMKRSLKLVMTPRLMRTITHSVVASVDMALGHTADPEENSYCRRCYNDGNSCMKCKTSRSYKYYQHYYATYYSEYFSEFYLQYYADSLLILDQFYNPDGFVSKLPAGFALKA